MDTKNLLKNKFRLFAFVSVFFFAGSFVDAATLKINASSINLSPGSITTLSVVANSEGIPINNAEAKIIFPADLLEVVSISKGGSIFSLWVEDPAYSNSTGIITFNGGVPTPGFNGSNGTVLSFVVKAKKAGQADILFSDAAVRADDGFGTDVLNSRTGRTLSIAAKEDPVVKETPVPAPAPTPNALQVTSRTHPSEESWYNDNNPVFKWNIPTGVNAVQAAIDTTPLASPRVLYTPAISEKAVTDLKDGLWYFKVRAQKDGKWGPTTTYITRIDTTAPKKNDVIFSYDDNEKILNIHADIVDETSGVDHFEIYINDALVQKVSSAEFASGKYSLPFSGVGDNTVTLIAVDRAGNSVESLGSFTSTAALEQIAPPQPSSRERFTIPKISLAIPLVNGVIIIAILLIVIAFILGRHYDRFHKRSRIQAAIANGDHAKVLYILKKRLEKHLELLQNTRRSRVLSKEEKEIKDGIESDLDEIDQTLTEEN